MHIFSSFEANRVKNKKPSERVKKPLLRPKKPLFVPPKATFRGCQKRLFTRYVQSVSVVLVIVVFQSMSSPQSATTTREGYFFLNKTPEICDNRGSGYSQ